MTVSPTAQRPDETDIRPLRGDAERNRRRLMEVAAEAFAEFGESVSVDEIARRAGLGKGTFFRHFGGKEHLIAAVARDRICELASIGEGLSEAEDPGVALRDFMAAAVERQLCDRGLFEAIGGLVHLEVEVSEGKARVIRIADVILRRAQEAGEIRADLVTSDLMLLVAAISHAAAPLHPHGPGLWRRYFDLIYDGLRPEAATPCAHEPPTEIELRAAFGQCPWDSRPADNPTG